MRLAPEPVAGSPALGIDLSVPSNGQTSTSQTSQGGYGKFFDNSTSSTGKVLFHVRLRGEPRTSNPLVLGDCRRYRTAGQFNIIFFDPSRYR